MNIIKKITYILALGAVLFTAAGCSDPDDELTSVEYDRLFKPTSFEAKVQNKGGFCIIPWIKMLNYPSISTKLS